MRPMGDIVSDLEDLVEEMVDDHDLQWGSIMAVVYDYLRVHRPDAQEEYVDGGNPYYYYGPEKEGLHLTRCNTIADLEIAAIREVMLRTRGNLTEAAKELGIGRAKLYAKVKKYNIGCLRD